MPTLNPIRALRERRLKQLAEQHRRSEYRTWLLHGRVGPRPELPTYTRAEMDRIRPFIDALAAVRVHVAGSDQFAKLINAEISANNAAIASAARVR